MNQLVEALPAVERDRLLDRARVCRVEPGDPLYEPGKHIHAVAFPTTSVISLLTVLGDGSAVETATVGREGMVGMFVFLGDDRSPNGRAVAQMGGEILRVDADDFRAQLADEGKLRQFMLDYTRALLVQVSQSVACSAAHPVRARLARWLLQTSDRIVANEVRLTQQFLAEILHVRRASVTEAARSLRDIGLVHVSRGRILILDRDGLEAAACECYGVIREEYAWLPGE